VRTLVQILLAMRHKRALLSVDRSTLNSIAGRKALVIVFLLRMLLLQLNRALETAHLVLLDRT